ncbi:MAG: hypothetical protein ILO53_08860 [Clostridia bacterium]|nr:hypothetical protein [Clostridia bacterium]
MSKFLTKAKSILSRRFVLIILSVLMAIVVWLLVMDATNPVTEMTVSVDVVFENFSMPAQRQLSLVSELGVVNAEVKVSGRQSLINKLLPSDITVKADFSKIKDTGSTYLTVDPPVCSKMGIKIVDYYPKEFAVSYDRKMEMYLPVRLNYSDGILKNGYEIISATTEPESIPVSGFATEIENLEYIVVNLSENISNESVDSDKTLTLIGRFMSNTGADLTANFETEKITVKIDVAKRVPVMYSVTGYPADDYFLAGEICDCEDVLLDGNTQDLLDIKFIDLGTIDISGITEDVVKTFKIADLISPRLYTAGSSSRLTEINVSLKVGQYETRVYEIDWDSITQAGRNDDLFTYVITLDEAITAPNGNLLVTLKGRSEDLDDITDATLKPAIELPAEGIYRNRNITFVIPDSVELIGEYLADIIVQRIPQATEIPTIPSSPSPSDDASLTPGITETPSGETPTPGDETETPSGTENLTESPTEYNTEEPTGENPTDEGHGDDRT